MVERAVVLETREWITSESLPQEMYETGSGGGSFEMPSGGIDLEEKLTDLERRIITDALKKTDGSKREAAKLLRVNLRSFRYKLSKYGL
jgi:two-component system response regulator PilR (NtrC family)